MFLYRNSKRETKLDGAAHVCNLNTQEGEVGGLPGVQGQHELHTKANFGKITKPCQKQTNNKKEQGHR